MQYLTVQQVAERYNVGDETVLDWIHFGDVKAINVSGSAKCKKKRYRITEKALEEFDLSRQTVGVPRTGRRVKRQEKVTQYF
jgi:excisionase family DNA binding protein